MRRLLVVDDDDDIRMLVRLSFERVGGNEVIEASNGREGLERARSDHPDAILLDVMMPELDGPATVRELQALPETAAIPVVLLTAKVQQRDRERFDLLPVRGTIPKPFDPIALPGQLDALLGLSGD
jgi:two-component system alkaline phosphatase synthesis response regulator PhoP